MLSYAVRIDGLSKYIEDIANLPDKQRRAIVAALNKTASHARTYAARRLPQQVNLGASYINERLTVSRKAVGNRLQAEISGRSRPTSLARFITRPGKERGQYVSVKPGVARYMKSAFVFKGGTNQQNRLLAVRTKGGPPKGAYKPVRLEDNLWLVYGPSVDQLFKQEIDRDHLDEYSLDYLEQEYLRLMEVEGF